MRGGNPRNLKVRSQNREVNGSAFLGVHGAQKEHQQGGYRF